MRPFRLLLLPKCTVFGNKKVTVRVSDYIAETVGLKLIFTKFACTMKNVPVRGYAAPLQEALTKCQHFQTFQDNFAPATHAPGHINLCRLLQCRKFVLTLL